MADVKKETDTPGTGTTGADVSPASDAQTPADKKVNPLNANLGIDFSLIGTRLHAAYEKKGNDGYAILLAPAKQTGDKGVSVQEVIDDIKKLASTVNKEADTSGMEQELNNSISGLKPKSDGKQFNLNELQIKLQMAYLYMNKSASESTLEYAFQLQLITEGLIPDEIANIVDVENISISVWNTNRKVIMDQMSLVTIDEYLGIPKKQAG